MIDLKSWGRNWNDAAVKRLALLQERPHSHVWPMLGMLAIGLVTGAALGGYAVTQRAQLRRLSAHAHRVGDGLAAMGSAEAQPADRVTTTRSNHRRKAALEV